MKGASVKNATPTASFEMAANKVAISTDLPFDASGSRDQETASDELVVRWDWNGDNIWDTEYSSVKSYTHKFPSVGIWTITMEVKDGSGLVDTETKTLMVGEGIVTDGRDRNQYAYKTIGNQTWMMENMAYLPSVSAPTAGSDNSNINYVYGYAGTSVAQAKARPNYKTYGVLYNAFAAKSACPPGWHLPDETDWKTLEGSLGMSTLASDSAGMRNSGSIGWKLKESGTAHWKSPNNGATNSSGFTAIPAGLRSIDGVCNSLGTGAFFWSFEGDASTTWDRGLYTESPGMDHVLDQNSYAFSVRCLKGTGLPFVTTTKITTISNTTASGGGNAAGDGGTPLTIKGVCWNTSENPTVSNSRTTNGSGTGTFTSAITGLSAGTTYYVRAYATNSVGTAYGEQEQFITTGGGDGTFTDIRDGHVYSYKTIGTQTWLTENVAYLPSVSPFSNGSATLPYYYVDGYEGSDVTAARAEAKYSTYGALYNWPAAKSACPAGWHLPNEAEWTTFKDYLTNNGYGYEGTGDDIAKSICATFSWALSSVPGTPGNNPSTNNRTGFSALAGGLRGESGGWAEPGAITYFWTTTEYPPMGILAFGMVYFSNNLGRFLNSPGWGFSVRCIH